MPSRESRVVRNRYSRLLFTNEDRLCANLRVHEKSDEYGVICQYLAIAWRHRSFMKTSQCLFKNTKIDQRQWRNERSMIVFSATGWSGHKIACKKIKWWLVMRFADDVHSWLRSSWKSLSNHLTRDQIIAIHENSCIIVYICSSSNQVGWFHGFSKRYPVVTVRCLRRLYVTCYTAWLFIVRYLYYHENLGFLTWDIIEQSFRFIKPCLWVPYFYSDNNVSFHWYYINSTHIYRSQNKQIHLRPAYKVPWLFPSARWIITDKTAFFHTSSWIVFFVHTVKIRQKHRILK